MLIVTEDVVSATDIKGVKLCKSAISDVFVAISAQCCVIIAVPVAIALVFVAISDVLSLILDAFVLVAVSNSSIFI